MMQAFIMVLREGFESFLIVAIILSYLRVSGRLSLRPAVYWGIGVAVGLSVLLGYLLMKGINQSLWEAILGVVTIVLVGSLVVHMWKAGARMSHEIRAKVDRYTAGATGLGLRLGVFVVTLILITREGMETALMLLQVREGGVLTGIGLGLLGVALVSWLWLRYSALINLKRFFQVTGAFLILFMVQVGIYSFHEFSEAGLLPQSEAIHIATEPFSPYGIYGQWFGPIMVGVAIMWLVIASLIDRRRRLGASSH